MDGRAHAGIRQGVAGVGFAVQQAQLAEAARRIRLQYGREKQVRVAAGGGAAYQLPAVYQHGAVGAERAVVIVQAQLARVDHVQIAARIHHGVGNRLAQGYVARVHAAHAVGMHGGFRHSTVYIQRSRPQVFVIAEEAAVQQHQVGIVVYNGIHQAAVHVLDGQRGADAVARYDGYILIAHAGKLDGFAQPVVIGGAAAAVQNLQLIGGPHHNVAAAGMEARARAYLHAP